MAEAPSNADLDLYEYSRDAANSTIKVLEADPDKGRRNEEVLGKPTPAKAKDDKPAESAKK